MENVITAIKVAGGVACGVATYIWGGMDAVLAVLLALIVIDYITGVMTALYRKELSSEVGFRGILRKVAILLVIAAAHLVGYGVGMPEIRSIVIGFYIANEGISIVENIGTMGVPLPQRVVDVLRQLKQDK